LGSNSVRIGQINENVYELEITPRFAIGQRAFLIISKNGNILWDCFPLLNAPTIEFIKAKGGLRGIAFSHPHYYSNMKDWAKTFDCPIYIHKSDEKWIMERGEKLYLWEGEELPLWDDIRMINIGGHFPGSSILHVPFLSKEGTIFVGDTVYVSPSMKHMAVMFSYPNRIPLPKEEVRKVKKRFDKVPFDKLFGFYSYQNVTQNPKSIMEAFMNRYLGE
jgi:glyoxylase-like metal-dependent hydrolase (beta-lactamase superfamily II)